jgi:hypothetical protein
MTTLLILIIVLLFFIARRNKAKPLIRQHGCMPIFTGGFKLGSGFYWVASEDPNYADTLSVKVNAKNGIAEISGSIIAVGGPFNTQAEADAAAEIAVAGDCEVTDAGAWDPAWSRPQ